MSQISTSCKNGRPELWGGGPSCQSGPGCKSAKAITGLGGPIGTATPFVDGTDLFQRICYSPPYLTETEGALDCVETFATMAGCRWDAECPPTHACVRAECRPREEIARITGGNAISAIGPRAVGWFARDDARVAEFVPAPYNTSAHAVKNYLEKACPSSTGVLVTECNTAQCGTSLVCPYYNGNPQARNCANCIRNLYKCDYFRGFMSEPEYQECKRKENVFQYDVATPNGTTPPALSYKMDPASLPVVREALYQCANDCGITPLLAL